tara:strand:+ start:10714 stop:10893 length:180 start_codon:yes stop_codon:yes gene_type:complete
MKTNEKNITYLQNVGKTSEWFIVRVQRNKIKYHKAFSNMEDAIFYRDRAFEKLGIENTK